LIFNLLCVGAGSALGGMMRYLTHATLYQWVPHHFPFGTLVVNIVGCSLIGFLGTLAEGRFLFHETQRLFLIVGFLGGFTTFSTFSFETWRLFQDGHVISAGLNVGSSVVGCFVGLILGVMLARLI
jgi:fluoride exporter